MTADRRTVSPAVGVVLPQSRSVERRRQAGAQEVRRARRMGFRRWNRVAGAGGGAWRQEERAGGAVCSGGEVRGAV